MVYKRNVMQIARLQIKSIEKIELNRMVELENPGRHRPTAFYSFLKEYRLIPIFNVFHPIKNYNMELNFPRGQESVFSKGRLRIENAGK
jgi:hypothetical protein